MTIYKGKKKLFIILIVMFTAAVQTANAQSISWGIVLDATTQEPIVGAIISDGQTGKAIAVTHDDGRFDIPQNGDLSSRLKDDRNNKANDCRRIRITYLGYKPLDTGRTPDNTYKMFTVYSEKNTLGEVVVTAQESRGLSSASVIRKQAMEHLQPSSFSDLLELLPGGRASTPSLNTPNNIYIREIATGNGNYATSALGTSFVIDGAPISTNANMQYMSGAWDAAATNRDNTNAGVDMRSISTDDIDRVEIIRGIPSVEYGDLTSGLVKIERRKGGRDLRFRLKTDMGSKLMYVAKDTEWESRRLTLNVSADYLNSKADPRNTYETYKRLTLSARLVKQWSSNAYHATFSANIDYTGSFDDDKSDPDINHGAEDSYRSSYNRLTTNLSLQLRMAKATWLRSVDATMSSAYEYDKTERTRLVQLQRMTIAPTAKTEGENDAVILPFKYIGSHATEGKPLNVFMKLNARLRVPSERITNTLLIGTDWNMDKNLGRGQIFDPMTPAYTGVSSRQRALSDIPANRRLSFFAEEQMKLPLGIGTLELMAGVRSSCMTNLPNDYVMHSHFYLDPRANLGYTLPRFTIGDKPVTIRLSAGLGCHTKMPTMEQLFPDMLYLDFVQLNYYHDNPDYRRINLMTYVRNPRNVKLEPARNRKMELTADVSIGGNRLSVTLFRENMESGFRSQPHYDSYHFRQYDASVIEASSLSASPSLADLPYTETDELSGYYNYTNGSLTLKEGVEYTFETERVPVILTRLTVNGAYFRTTYNNSLEDAYRPSQVLDNRQIQYVGLYQNNDGSVRESFNTNFTLDTNVPRLRLGFSVSAQCLWYTSSQRKEVDNYPVSYIAPDGTVHEWTDECESNPYLRYLVRENSPSNFERNVVPFSMNLNFKVTKRLLADRISVAMFCNKLWDYTPDYVSRGATIRRHVTPYFGLEMNLKL